MKMALSVIFRFCEQIIGAAIKLYQKWLSPLLPSACRYHPTCSDYALQALAKYGFVKGIYKSMLRILKCNPFFPGGHDPV